MKRTGQLDKSSARDRIRSGTRVYAADGRQLGIVLEANAGYIVVGEGPVFPTDYFVPTSAVGRYGGGRADLTVSTAEALGSGWDRGQSGGA
jgi:hypothetical protein